MPTVLIVDDSATNRRIYVKLAQNLGKDIEVRSFAQPREVIMWLEENDADLIITDYKMPDLNGAELVAEIRTKSPDSDIPIIVITAYDDREFRMTSLEAGATDFLLSPVDHVEFMTRARNLLKLRMQQQILLQRANLLERHLEVSLTTHKQLMRENREALAQVIDTVPASISAADRDGRCVFANALFAFEVGATPADLVGKPVKMLLGTERAAISRRLDCMVFDTGQAVPTREEEVSTDTGEKRIYLTSKVPLRDDRGEVSSVLTTSVDITERREFESRLQHLVNHDPLTGLPNRKSLRDRVRRELARGRRGDLQFAILFIDLDRFKAVNDAHGHHYGDRVLCKVGEILSNLIGEGDTVARIAGDEFAVLQSGISGPNEVSAMAEAIVARLNQSDEAAVGASIGITLAPLDGTDPDELLKNSDQAMYSAKAMGGSTWQFYTPEMRPRASQIASLEADLRRAVANEEFVLHYQPQIDLRRGTIVGAEALLRWERPGHGLVSPGAFLALAEETGLIVPINEWVLREACHQLAAWKQAGLDDLRIAVNLSPIQFRRRRVPSLVREILAETGINPALLDLELTESFLIGDVTDVTSQLSAIRELGVMLSLDDFGTGYSSLSYIRNFPLDRLKIDRSFIQGLANSQSDLAIVRTVIDLGHILHLRVVAEGVETDVQLALLKAEGCDEVQGFYFSAALPPNVFMEWVMRQGPDGPKSIFQHDAD